MKNAIERLIRAIGYPDKVSGGAVSFMFRVDGMEVNAEENDGRLVLSYALTNDDTLLPMLAAYAAGRMLKESATLAYGVVAGLKPAAQPANRQAFLWQDASADAHGLLRLFETFMDSCDWWRARLEPRSGADGPSPFSEVMIRP